MALDLGHLPKAAFAGFLCCKVALFVSFPVFKVLKNLVPTTELCYLCNQVDVPIDTASLSGLNGLAV